MNLFVYLAMYRAEGILYTLFRNGIRIDRNIRIDRITNAGAVFVPISIHNLILLN